MDENKKLPLWQNSAKKVDSGDDNKWVVIKVPVLHSLFKALWVEIVQMCKYLQVRWVKEAKLNPQMEAGSSDQQLNVLDVTWKEAWTNETKACFKLKQEAHPES